MKVLSLDEEKMVVVRGNGKEAVISRRDLVHVDQGVTVTSYSSQSKGPDQMLCSAPVRSFGAVDRKQFYVTMSRARRSMHLYTDSVDGLREAVCRTGERLSAVELANDAEAYLQRMQEVLARNTFQAKRTANLQHGIEPPLGPTLKEADPSRMLCALPRQDECWSQATLHAWPAPQASHGTGRTQRPDRDRGHSIGM